MSAKPLKVDLHNHTSLCNHCDGKMEDFVLRAIEQQIDIFGFSDHAPMDFDTAYRMTIKEKVFYESEVLFLRKKYQEKIEILVGYEVDFLDGYIEKEIVEANVDYLIGSVHFINKWGFDNPNFIGKYAEYDIDFLWKEYFRAISQMAKCGKFDIVGHLDLLKIFKHMPKKNIKLLALKAIQDIKNANMVVEINAAGLRKPICEQYPSRDLLELCFEFGVEITFGSDAHKIEDIGIGHLSSVELAKEIGYTKCAIFRNRDKELVIF